MIAIVIFGLAIDSNAQIPNYVPTDGLVGWWPFNGNADDESINGNNGTVNGAVLTTDRNGNANTSYYFDGVDDFIEVPNNASVTLTNDLSMSAWVNTNGSNGQNYQSIISKRETYWTWEYNMILSYHNGIIHDTKLLTSRALGIGNQEQAFTTTPYTTLNWEFWTVVYSSGQVSLYKNGILDQTQPFTLVPNEQICPLLFGKNTLVDNSEQFLGAIDDIGIWNRALNEQEITNLYNASICSNSLTISPAANQIQTGITANFTATTSDANPSFIWQSDFGQGYVTLNNYGNYSGVNTNSLSILNVQLSEHNQPIRVISTSGECIDTSNVATINITDTCIVTINDTITTLISVTDTLVINTLITGLTPPNNSNTIKVFPNPANSHVTIDFGYFESMNGYTLTITNSIGQTVYTTPINEQSSYIDLSTWSGNGIYFVQIIDTQNNTIENRKIVLQ